MYVTTYSPGTDCLFYRYILYFIAHMWSDKNKIIKGCGTRIIIQNWVSIFVCIDSSNLSSETFLVEVTMKKLLNLIGWSLS